MKEDKMRRTTTLIIGIVVGAALWGTALAAIPDAGGVIHGCYKPSDEKLRVIDTEAGRTCASNETALSWNQTGPQGPTGPTGATGASGATGPQGPAGPIPTYERQFKEV